MVKGAGSRRTEEGGRAAQSAEIWSDEKSGQSQLSSSNASLARRSASCAADADVDVVIGWEAATGEIPCVVPPRMQKLTQSGHLGSPVKDHLSALIEHIEDVGFAIFKGRILQFGIWHAEIS